MKIIRPPQLVTRLYHSLEWHGGGKDSKKIHLTFDDGPTPNITEFVLNELDKVNAKATFFCIGKNIQQHPAIFNQVMKQGHQIGNHTFNHVNGWKTSTANYLAEIENCNQTIAEHLPQVSNSKLLFRPPYGKITRTQIASIKAQYRIIMWSVLSYDWLPEKKENQCFNNITVHLKSNSIIVLHDSVKAAENVKKTLPKLLRFAQNEGYSFDLL